MGKPKDKITEAMRRALARGAKHEHGVITTVMISGFDVHNERRRLHKMEAMGLIEANAHGDYYITDAGRKAVAGPDRPEPELVGPVITGIDAAEASDILEIGKYRIHDNGIFMIGYNVRIATFSPATAVTREVFAKAFLAANKAFRAKGSK